MAEAGIVLGPFTIVKQSDGWISIQYRLSDKYLESANEKQRAAAASPKELLRIHEAKDLLITFPLTTLLHHENFLRPKYGRLGATSQTLAQQE
jgi:hypothetical protein